MSVPSRERVLRSLFWKLLFRGRTVQQANTPRRRKQIGLVGTSVIYAAFGIAPGLTAAWVPPFVFASSLHVMTMLFASLVLASTVGTTLFVREEAEILLHRPVRAEEVLRAKCAVLIAFSLFTAFALNAVGFVTSFWNRGNAWWFFAAHALTTALLMLFSLAAVVLVYDLCLRWLGRERFDNLLTLVQVLMTIVMVGAAQFVIPALDSEALRGLAPTSAWAFALPPLWFAALDVVLCGALPFAAAWAPAAVGVAVTLLLAWLAFVKLGSSYGTGLMRLAETNATAVDRPRRRLLGTLLALPPLRWWLRDPVERQAFLLASAYLVRDRETKLKVWPSLAPAIVIPIAMALLPNRRASAEADVFAAAMPLTFAAMMPMGVMTLLQRSEQHAAAELFRRAPLAHWAPLFHGARKAVVVWIAAPCLLAAVTVLALIRGSVAPVAMAAPMVFLLLPASTLPGLFRPWLPLSLPNGDVRDTTTGCLVGGLAMFASLGLAMLGGWLFTIGMFWPFAALVACASVALQHVFAAMMRRRPWRLARE